MIAKTGICHIRQFFLIFIGFSFQYQLTAQLYLETVGGVLPLNLCDCSIGPPVLPIGTGAIALASNQNLLYLANAEVFQYNITTGITTTVGPIPNDGNGMVAGPNGIIYVVGVNPSGVDASVTALNPVTGISTNLGNLPAGMFPSGDMFFYNGNLYCTVEFNGENNVALIPINDPSAATTIFGPTTWSGSLGAVSLFVDGVETVFLSTFDGITGLEGIYQLDMTTGAVTFVCSAFQVFDMAALTGSSISACCNNFAGTFVQSSLVSVCQNELLSLTHNGNESLNPGSSLSFVLVTNPNANLPTGLLEINSSPEFSFDPATMTPLTTYYVAAVAAPLVNGAPDWNNSCVDISSFVPVRWLPLPSVSFSVPNSTLCDGTCLTVTASFTGTAPFNLDFSTTGGAFSQVFSGNTGSFQVCAPAGTPPGPFQVQALSLSDASCSCN